MGDMAFLRTLRLSLMDMPCHHMLGMVLRLKVPKEIVELLTKGNLQNRMTVVLLRGMLLHYK
jgi:hypothetical protein